MDGNADTADGLLRRSDIEIELAHLVLRLARRVDTDGDQADGRQRILAWFQTAADELVERTAAMDRVFVTRRLADIAKTIADFDTGPNHGDPYRSA